jgi:vitamin B12/bleomycin/antimicrobial peptide transport system ATP-binding/permease protein
LYQELQASGMTFLSVGHRESLSNYHQSTLDLTAVDAAAKSAQKTWVLTAVDRLPLET